MFMNHNLLRHYARAHTSFLHARGRLATEVLVHELRCAPGEKVLEIGFGTGATLVRLSTRHPQTSFAGVDAEPLMHQKALERMRFCRLKDGIVLTCVPPSEPLPYSAGCFDVVYAESVLVIQEGDGPLMMLQEMHRILKPGGRLVLNETLWLDETSPETIEHINDGCREAFGIVQCNGSYPYLSDWLVLFGRLGFTCEKVVELETVQAHDFPSRRTVQQGLSNLFTTIGMVKKLLSPSLRRAEIAFRRRMQTILPPDGKPLMAGRILAARKNSDVSY